MAPIARVAALVLLASSAAASVIDLQSIMRQGKDSMKLYKRVDEAGTAGCAESIEITDAIFNSPKNVFSVNAGDISENGKKCDGTGPKLNVLKEEDLRVKGKLDELKFPLTAQGLQGNKNAMDILNADRDQRTKMLVAFAEGERNCGANKYPPGSVFFLVNEPDTRKQLAVLVKQRDGKQKTILFNPNTKVIMQLSPDNTVCAFHHKDVKPGEFAATVQPITVSEGDTTRKPNVNHTKAKKETKEAKANDATTTTTEQTGETTTDPAVDPSPQPDGSVPEGSAPTTGGETTPNEAEPSVSPEAESRVCFPGSGSVELASGKFVTMKDLRIGDRVRTGPDSFSDIFLFTHRDANVHEQFVRLVTAAGPAVTLTKSHYLYANGALVAAGSVRNGDVLSLADGSSSTVSTVENVSADGLYNPQTVDGNIVVDGVVSSAYTTAVHPRVAHSALLSPLRCLYERAPAAGAFLDALTGFISGNTNKLASVVPGGPAALA